MTFGDGRAVPVLLVEDNPGDVRLTIEAFKHAEVRQDLQVARDGVEALRYLHCEAPFQDAVRPHLILLDLNLPRKNGQEVLSEIKADPNLRRIPVVMLTTSSAEEDVLRSYDLHANCYITKPVDFEEFTRVIGLIKDFWLSVVRLPPRKG